MYFKYNSNRTQKLYFRRRLTQYSTNMLNIDHMIRNSIDINRQFSL